MVGVILNLCVLNVYGNSVKFAPCRDNLGIRLLESFGTRLL